VPRNGDARSNPKLFLGDKSRRGRIAAGFTSHAALATAIGFDRTVITKVGAGDRVPSPDVLAAWCEACRLDLEMYGDLAGLARSTDETVPAWFADYLEAERDARTLRIWQPLIVPGPLRAADYARDLFTKARNDPAKIDGMVATRLERQKIFERADPPHTVVVLDELALHHLIGTPEVMHNQLMHLADVAETVQLTGRARVTWRERGIEWRFHHRVNRRSAGRAAHGSD
jgi:hypothetical protein